MSVPGAIHRTEVTMSEEKKLAVLIDSDNVSAKYASVRHERGAEVRRARPTREFTVTGKKAATAGMLPQSTTR